MARQVPIEYFGEDIVSLAWVANVVALHPSGVPSSASSMIRNMRTSFRRRGGWGGLRRKKETTVSLAYDFEGLGSIPQVRRLVEVAAIDALRLENSLGRVRALGYLAQVAVMLLEKGEHEERLEAIEAALGPRLINDKNKGRSR